MRILMVTSHSDRSETSLYSRLRQAGVDVHVACDPESARLETLKAAGVPVYRLAYRSRLDVSAVRLLRRMLIEGCYDVVHTFNKRALTHVMLAARGLPVKIMTYRGIIGNLSRWNPEVRWTFFNRRLAGMVCVCDAVRDYVVSVGIPDAKARRIYKGHDPAWYKPAPRSALTALGLPENACVVGCAGHLRARKGLGTLVEAFARRRCQNMRLLLVGAISDDRARASIAALGLQDVVYMTGFRGDAAALIGACDMFVMPSLRREGLPRAVIEAMIQGVPAVVTRVGGMPEIVEDGKSGRIVAPGDAVALADAMDFLAEDNGRRRAFGEAARARILSAFNIEATVRETLKFYEDVLGTALR